jgi:nitrogen regulatory protein PII
MDSLCNQKLVQIITSNILDSRIKKIFKKLSISSYTNFNVNGEGDSGLQSGHFDADSNIMFMVMVSSDKFDSLIAELNRDIEKGYHHFVFSLNAEVHSPNKCRPSAK